MQIPPTTLGNLTVWALFLCVGFSLGAAFMASGNKNCPRCARLKKLLERRSREVNTQ